MVESVGVVYIGHSAMKISISCLRRLLHCVIPDPEDQDYGANLSSDGKESSHSSFEPKFTPAIISISSKIK